MKVKIILTALFMALALPAAAQFRTVAAAYEVALSDIRLPRSTAGTIAYKKCSECPYETRRVDASTVWEVDGQALPLEKFRQAVSGVADPRQETVQVLHHLEENRITKVWILLR